MNEEQKLTIAAYQKIEEINRCNLLLQKLQEELQVLQMSIHKERNDNKDSTK